MGATGVIELTTNPIVCIFSPVCEVGFMWLFWNVCCRVLALLLKVGCLHPERELSRGAEPCGKPWSQAEVEGSAVCVLLILGFLYKMGRITTPLLVLPGHFGGGRSYVNI